MAARRAASEDEDITEEGIRASDKDTDSGREECIREMNELLQELRVILPGVQVLATKPGALLKRGVHAA